MDYEFISKIFEKIKSIESSSLSIEEKSKKIEEIIYYNGDGFLMVDEINECVTNMVKQCMDELNIDKDYYSLIYKYFCYGFREELYSFKDTRIERYSEDDIELNESDAQLAHQNIKNGIEYCAYYIASQIIDHQFIKNPSQETKEFVYSHHSGWSDKKGHQIEPAATAIFIKSLIEILNDGYKKEFSNKEKIKKIFIGALGKDHFEVTKGKKYIKDGEILNGPEGYNLAFIDNDYDAKISRALEKAGLSGMFTKAFNKKIFSIKNKRFGYISMYTGHWIPKFDTTSNQKLQEYKNEVIFKLTSELPENDAKSIIMFLKDDNIAKLDNKNNKIR